jgi:hypothetical protein
LNGISWKFRAGLLSRAAGPGMTSYEKREDIFACPPTIQKDLGGYHSDGSAQRRCENSWHSVAE